MSLDSDITQTAYKAEVVVRQFLEEAFRSSSGQQWISSVSDWVRLEQTQSQCTPRGSSQATMSRSVLAQSLKFQSPKYAVCYATNGFIVFIHT